MQHCQSKSYATNSPTIRLHSPQQYSPNLIVSHLNSDNTFGDCCAPIDVNSASPTPDMLNSSPNLHHRYEEPTTTTQCHPASVRVNLSPYASSPNSQQSAGSNTQNHQRVSVRCSSVDRVPSQNSCCSPLEIHYNKDGQQVFQEQEHRMTINGDSLTLVIVDCSPTPGHGDYSVSRNQGVASRDGGSAVPPTTSPVYHPIPGTCDECCSHTTQLIVRQHHASAEHHHHCGHTNSTRSGGSSDVPPSTQGQQQPTLSIEAPSPKRGYREETEETTRITAEETTRQHRINEQHQSHEDYMYPSRSPNNYFHKQTSQYNTTLDDSIEDSSRQYLSQPQQYHNNMQQVDPEYHRTVVEQPIMSSTELQSAKTPGSRDSSYSNPRELYSGGRDSGGQDKHNLVKRWDWNKQEFVYTEPAPGGRKQMPPPSQPPKPEVAQAVESHEPRSVTQTTTTTRTEQTLEDREWSTQEPRPSTSSSSPQISRYEPSWLAYKVPDMESMRTDPLYSDLMYEIKCLEDTLQPKESVMVDEGIEEFHKPVFGQSMTPEHIEVDEYGNAEFVSRLIPNADPSMRIEWTVNGQPLKDSNRYTCEYDFGVVRLRIKRCEAEDSGIYQCRASNSLGEAITTGSLKVQAKGNIQCESLHPAGLDKIRQLENPPASEHVEEQESQQPPKFITHIQDYMEKSEGDSVHFECCLSPVDDPDLKTEWFFNGRPLVTGSRFHTIDDFGFIVLDIDWLFPRDTGEYVCRATNKHGSDVTRSVLRVKPDKNIVLDSQLDNPTLIDKLRLLEFPDVEQQVEEETPNKPAHFVQHLTTEGKVRQYVEGDNVHFEARVAPANDGSLQLEWFHNDRPLASGHRFKPTFDFGHIQLDILYVYAEDSGVYKCVARNGSGQDVSQFEIQVTGKPSLVYQCQLPKEMEGGVQKITDMEAMWNKPPEEDDEPEPTVKTQPVFVLTPKPCLAFEGSCARFCCRVSGSPRPRLVWTLNGQIVVTGSRHKLTYDGMHHLTIPKCQLSDAGKLEVHARNPLGECYASTQLFVKRKVDDYRGVLKNSPNPWYDEQCLKMYQRQRSQDTDEEEIYYSSMKKAQGEQLSSPLGIQVVGYMEPNTPDVNLLMQNHPPLFSGSDLHPLVYEQQAIMAPAPSTVQWALASKDKIKTAEKSYHITPDTRERFQIPTDSSARKHQEVEESHFTQPQQPLEHQHKQHQSENSKLPQSLIHQQQKRQLQDQQTQQQQGPISQSSNRNQQHSTNQSLTSGNQKSQPSVRGRTDEGFNGQSDMRGFEDSYDDKFEHQRTISSISSDSRLPPPSPSQDASQGKEVQSVTYKQTQRERRADREIVREIIEKETFEQEHKALTKENVVRGGSRERTPTPTPSEIAHQQHQQYQHQQQHVKQQQQTDRQVHFQEDIEVVEEAWTPPEFIQKIQPCQTFEGDEARFECTYRGDPAPVISWFRESKQVKASNLYQITSDETKSTLVIKRVTLNCNSVFTVKAENCAGSARSSANLVVEPHPLPLLQTPAHGIVRNVPVSDPMLASRSESPAKWSYQASSSSSTGPMVAGNLDEMADSAESLNRKIIRSVKTRTLGDGELSHMIRASPEGLVAPAFMHSIHDVQCRLGELARFDARLVGSQPMEFRWLKDGERLRADKSHKMVLEGDLYTLLILEVSARDQGLYECLACNSVGEARCEARLTIASGADRAGAVDSMTAGTYQSAKASSSSSSSTMTSSHQQQRTSTSSQSLNVAGSSAKTTTSADHPANNQDAQHGAPKQQRQYFGVQRHQYNPLMTQYSPNSASGADRRQQVAPKLIKKLENQQVVEGKSVTLRCQISSYPPAEVNWYKGDRLIKASKYFRIFKDNDETYCLKILETFPEDQGEYRCIARASNGRIETKVEETKAHISVIPLSPK